MWFCMVASCLQLFVIILCIFVLLGIRKAYKHSDVRHDPFIYISYLAMFFYIGSMVAQEDAVLTAMVTKNDTVDAPVGSMKLLEYGLVFFPYFVPFLLNMYWIFYFFLHSAWLRLFKPPHNSNLIAAIMVFPAHMIVMCFLLQCHLRVEIAELYFKQACSTESKDFLNKWKQYVMIIPVRCTCISYIPCGFVILWKWLQTGRVNRYWKQFFGSCIVGCLIYALQLIYSFVFATHTAALVHITTVLGADEAVRHYTYTLVIQFFYPTISTTVSDSSMQSGTENAVVTKSDPNSTELT